MCVVLLVCPSTEPPMEGTLADRFCMFEGKVVRQPGQSDVFQYGGTVYNVDKELYVISAKAEDVVMDHITGLDLIGVFKLKNGTMGMVPDECWYSPQDGNPFHGVGYREALKRAQLWDDKGPHAGLTVVMKAQKHRVRAKPGPRGECFAWWVRVLTSMGWSRWVVCR